MPELPDVEGYRIALTKYLPGLQVRDVRVLDAGALRNTTAKNFGKRLTGHRFATPRRHGKWLILPTDGPTLLVHSGMTGRPYFVDTDTDTDTDADADSDVDPRDRLIIGTDGGDLHYADLRKLRGVWIVDDDADIDGVTGEQGPDALGISAPAFRAALRGRRGAVKTVLMNQQVIAGLGNMLTDEICWRARVHPARTVDTLDDTALTALHREMRRVLRAAVKKGEIPRTRLWLNSTRDRDPAACPRCHTTLRRTRIGGRTSIWCPHCQPAPVNRK